MILNSLSMTWYHISHLLWTLLLPPGPLKLPYPGSNQLTSPLLDGIEGPGNLLAGDDIKLNTVVIFTFNAHIVLGGSWYTIDFILFQR